MKQALKILLLEDSETDAELIQRFLYKEIKGCICKLTNSRKTFLIALEEFAADVILCDNSLPGFNGVAALKIVRQRVRQIPFILVTGTVSEEYAAGIIKLGADDYILKDRMTRLPAAIAAALKQRKSENEKESDRQLVVQSEEKYRNLVEQAFDGIIIYSPGGAILDCNHTACEFMGYTKKELKLLTVPEVFFIGDLVATSLHLDISSNPSAPIKYRRLKRKDGSYLQTEINAKVMPDGNIMAFARDITERKRAQLRLRTANDRLYFHIKNTPLGFIEWDDHLRLKYWSKRAEDIFGWTESEFILLQKDGYSLVYEEDRLMATKFAEQLITGAVIRNHVQYRNYTKDGGVIWCEWFNSVLKDSDGKVIVILSLVQDITKRKKSEQNLQQSEMRLNEAQAIAHISNWEVDLVQNIHSWSDELYVIYGIQKKEVQPSLELFLSFIHPDDVDIAQKKIQDALASCHDSSFYFRLIRKDGGIRYAYTEWKFECDKEGKPLRLFGILQDITVRKEVEEELVLLEQRILTQKLQEQKKITRAIIKAEERERNRIGQELHDNVNQILVGTKLYLAMAGKKNPTTKKLIKYPMELIDSSIQEIRLLSNKNVTPLKNIDLAELVQSKLDKLRENTSLKTVLVCNMADTQITDDLKLNIFRIIQEQINNIVKHASCKIVSIAIQAVKNVMHITITDDGKGFDPNKKRKGIGISNMMNRIESFDGELKIESSPGKGCSLKIRIPIM